jgi:hypothetical protein
MQEYYFRRQHCLCPGRFQQLDCLNPLEFCCPLLKIS